MSTRSVLSGLVPSAYREALRSTGVRRLVPGLGLSALGDGMSYVTIAWLAIQLAPPRHEGIFVSTAVAAYTLPGVVGAWAFGRLLRRRSARGLVLAHCLLRCCCLGSVVALYAAGALDAAVYVVLLAASSLLGAWGIAGEYTILAELAGPDGRMAVNALASAQTSVAYVAGPTLAGLLLAPAGAGWLLAADAASFAVLGLQAWRVPPVQAAPHAPVDIREARSGLRVLRRPDLLSLIVVSALFFFLYGPVEVALPVYVARDLHAGAGLLGAYWACYGIGAFAATLAAGALRTRNIRRATLLIVAGWGACLLPFAGAPVGVTLACFALGGLVYGPFIPMTYALFQAAAEPKNLPSLLATRSAILMAAAPLGTAAGGPLVTLLGASGTLVASGAATILLAVGASVTWRNAHERVTARPASDGRSSASPADRGAST